MMRLAVRLIAWAVPAFAAGAASVGWPALAAEIPLAERRSGYELMRPETRAMEDDEAGNPGMLWVLEGQDLWSAKPGPEARSCADCHGEASVSMKGVAVRYPAFDSVAGQPLDLEQRINACRTKQQHAPAFAFESRQLLAITAYVARQSRGMRIEIAADARNEPFLAAGREQFERRRGQLNLACSQCHDDNWGRHLAGSLIPQAHPTGYPLYRLEWQGLGSLQRRLRACISGVRSEPDDYGAPELVNLELFLMWRARGMVWESPAVRP
ncbi:MAG TPA: sulfur oxidation c-type cytochrome SoxA [Burkholderiaceae bacterium]|nr:sulfur oxidation c-type cytochrome SoxA [Burkholderiaceae bacterium]